MAAKHSRPRPAHLVEELGGFLPAQLAHQVEEGELRVGLLLGLQPEQALAEDLRTREGGRQRGLSISACAVWRAAWAAAQRRRQQAAQRGPLR